MTLSDYNAARKQVFQSIDERLDLRVELDPLSRKGGHIRSGKADEVVTWNVDGVADHEYSPAELVDRQLVRLAGGLNADFVCTKE